MGPEQKVIPPVQKRDIVVFFVTIVVAVTSFGLGRLSAGDVKKGEIRIESTASSAVAAFADSSTTTPSQIYSTQGPIEGGVVASRTGNVYHLPWCSGAKRILEKNKIWFKSPQEARKAGLTPAANCKGLE
jgi:hypothetical protein